jgi:hypothetical protein
LKEKIIILRIETFAVDQIDNQRRGLRKWIRQENRDSVE